MHLEGRTAIVTGGTGELGGVIARRLGLEGCRIFVAARGSRPTGNPVRESNEMVRIIRADVTDEKEVVSLFDAVMRDAGKAEILINCAGAFAVTGPFPETPATEWDRLLAVNLRSVFLCSREFLRRRPSGEYGRIVNFTAQTVFRPSRHRSAYAVAKQGVATLTQLIAEEVRGGGITANAIAPGIVRTGENLRSNPGADSAGWVEPEDIASEVVHLCGAAAGSINGAVIPMFGGV